MHVILGVFWAISSSKDMRVEAFLAFHLTLIKDIREGVFWAT